MLTREEEEEYIQRIKACVIALNDVMLEAVCAGLDVQLFMPHNITFQVGHTHTKRSPESHTP